MMPKKELFSFPQHRILVSICDYSPTNPGSLVIRKNDTYASLMDINEDWVRDACMLLDASDGNIPNVGARMATGLLMQYYVLEPKDRGDTFIHLTVGEPRIS